MGAPGVRPAPNEEEWYEEKDCRGSCRSGDAGIGRAGGRGIGIGGAQGAGRADQGSVDLRRAAQRRRLVAGARRGPAVRAEAARLQGRQTTYKENVPEGPQVAAGDRQPRPRRQQDHLRHLVRLQRRDVRGGEEVPGREVRAGDRLQDAPRTSPTYFGAGEDAIYLSGMAAGAATKTGVIGYVVPFPIPEVIRHANAFALGAQATHPGRRSSSCGRSRGSTRPRRRRRPRASRLPEPT